ncbi:hypothetical protein MGN70_008651 [Eutypa lata]|nr:hypothetical protein MGN70_008651 [Eutypa lata]
MDDNDMEYGFNIALLEDERTIPSFGRMAGSFVLRRSSVPVPEMATTTINNTKSKGSPRAPFTAQTEDLARAPFLSGTVSRQGQTSPTDGLPAPEMGTGLRLRQPAQSYRFQHAVEHAAACQKAPSPKRPGLLVTLSTDLILLATNSPSQERQQI